MRCGGVVVGAHPSRGNDSDDDVARCVLDVLDKVRLHATRFRGREGETRRVLRSQARSRGLDCEKPKKALKSSPPITTHFYTRNGSESAPPDTCTKWWCTSDDPVLLGVATVAMLTGIGGAALFSPIFLLGFPLLGPEYPLETATAGGRGVRPFTSTDG